MTSRPKSRIRNADSTVILDEPPLIPSRFAELDAVIGVLPPRLEGDIDAFEYSEHLGISANQARRLMLDLSRKDKAWKFMLVRDPKRRNAVVVLRKVLQ